MLELNQVSLLKGSGEDKQVILHEISIQLPSKHFCAVLGPSGSGKFALLQVIAQVEKPGGLDWKSGPDDHPTLDSPRIGLIAERDSSHGFLTVEESIEEAIALRVRGKSERKQEAQKILQEVGLASTGTHLVKTLSDEQHARLNLGIELAASPDILLCQNLAGNLDPRSEYEILKLLRHIARNCLVLLDTQNLRHLEVFDSIAILHEGHLAYHGPGEFLFHYFNITNPEELYPRLSQRRASEWHASWLKHGSAYYAAQKDGSQPVKKEDSEQALKADLRTNAIGNKKKPKRARVSVFLQTKVLFQRRCKELLRNRPKLLLELALLLGLPCMVILFNWNVLPQIVRSTGFPTPGRVVPLLQMLVLCQVILLGFAGVINGAGEISGERDSFEKEKWAGLRPLGYIASKALFLGLLAAAQSLWMTLYVKEVSHLPGRFWEPAAFLFCTNAAMTSLSLGVSSLFRCRGKASTVVLYLAAIQLPLSGTVLALPESICRITRFVTPAYWGWAGYLKSSALPSLQGSLPESTSFCFAVLAIQCFLGLSLSLLGTIRRT